MSFRVPLTSVRIPRRIDASPAEVFDAWADPDLFRQWFAPRRAVLRPAAVDELVLTHSGLPDDEMGRGHEGGWTGITGILADKIRGLKR